MSEIPRLESYTETELDAASSWPAVRRYLTIVKRTPKTELEELKCQRHEAWLRCAVALFFNKASDEDICRFWSDAADHHLTRAAQLTGLDKTETAVFALGKLGAQELNLSSDVDLVLIAGDDSPPALKEAREFIKVLSESDEWGFCHRVDVALRPGGNSASLVPTYSQFESHYGYHGEAWERLAYIRARHLFGAPPIAHQVTQFAKSFSYRRHLDYTVLEELRLLINRIRSENPIRNQSEFNLKIHPGGIRDIELFVHSLQAVHGGRNQSLQTHQTGSAIHALELARLVSKEDAKTLRENYWYFRGLENRLQSENDEQTYRYSDPEFLPEVRRRASQVLAISSSAFPSVKEAPELDREDLVRRGFSAATVDSVLPELHESRVRSKKSERDERERRSFLNSFVLALEESHGEKDLGLNLLADFVKSTRAKATLFTLLNRETALMRQLATLFGTSPYAGQLLCSRPELLDSLILQQEPSDLALDEKEPGLALDSLADRRLLGELIATLHFLENRNLETCVQNLTRLADSIATDLMLITAREIGVEPLGLIALGKWGGQELGLRSDLDFVFVSQAPPSADQQRLARRFLNRMTESHRGGSMYSVDLRLRPSGNSGPLLLEFKQIDAHLRFKAEAWERQSWLRARIIESLPFDSGWDITSAVFSTQPGSESPGRGLTSIEESELANIASQLFKTLDVSTMGEARSSSSRERHFTIDLKLTEGGLAPIEFAAQISILRLGPTASRPHRIQLETSTQGMIQFLEERDPLWKAEGPRLREIHHWLRVLEQWHRITSDVSGSKLSAGSQEFNRMARSIGESAGDESANGLTTRLQEMLAESAKRIKTVLGR